MLAGWWKWCCPCRCNSRAGYDALKASVFGTSHDEDIEAGARATVVGAAAVTGVVGTLSAGESFAKLVDEKEEGSAPAGGHHFYDACSEYGDDTTTRASATDEPASLTDVEIACFYNVSVQAIRELGLEFIDSPPAELARYLSRQSVSGCPKAAAPLLRTYMEWRTQQIPRWPPSPPEMINPLRNIGRAPDGSVLILFVPAMIDTKFKPEQYTQAMVRCMEVWVPREQSTFLTIFGDVRGHYDLGYNGKSAFRLFHHLAAMASNFQTHFPGRLAKAVAFPAGRFEMKLYNTLSLGISKSTAKRLSLLFHPKGANAPCPPREILQYMDLDTISADDLVFFRGLEEVDARLRSLSENGKDGACDMPTLADCGLAE